MLLTILSICFITIATICFSLASLKKFKHPSFTKLFDMHGILSDLVWKINEFGKHWIKQLNNDKLEVHKIENFAANEGFLEAMDKIEKKLKTIDVYELDKFYKNVAWSNLLVMTGLFSTICSVVLQIIQQALST